jgi:hypothetical protein
LSLRGGAAEFPTSPWSSGGAGTLVNAIFNDPGRLSICDQEMEVRLSGLLQLLQAEMKTSSAAVVRADAANRSWRIHRQW